MRGECCAVDCVPSMMESNVYSFEGVVLIAGSCLPQMAQEAFASLAAQADGVYTLCLEQTHINMAVTKLTAVLGTGKVSRLLLASVDRSPHCTQMHYIRHEIERVLPQHIPIEDYVLCNGELLRVSEEAVELSKSLARLTKLTQET